MKTIFEPAVRKELMERANKLTVHSPRVFGTMKPEQGLHHINAAFQMYLGEIKAPYQGNAFTSGLLKVFIFSPIPFPRGKAKTFKELISEATYNIENEKKRFQDLLERVAARANKAEWPVHPIFGKLTADQYGKLAYKHTDHHLQQFGV